MAIIVVRGSALWKPRNAPKFPLPGCYQPIWDLSIHGSDNGSDSNSEPDVLPDLVPAIDGRQFELEMTTASTIMPVHGMLRRSQVTKPTWTRSQARLAALSGRKRKPDQLK